MRYQETVGVDDRGLGMRFRKTDLQKAGKAGQAHFRQQDAHGLIVHRVYDLNADGNGRIRAHVLLKAADELAGLYDLVEQRIARKIPQFIIAPEAAYAHGFGAGGVHH